MRMTLESGLQKKVNKYGSVLKAYRTMGGAGAAIIGLGIMLIACGAFVGALLAIVKIIGGIILFIVMAISGVILIPIGNKIHTKRVNNYLEFFQQDTGYSVEELQQADRELMSPDAVMIGGKVDDGSTRVVFIVTEHYFLSVWPIKGAYLRKLNDIVAAFYSNEIPGNGGYRQNLFVITRQDTMMSGMKNEYTGKQYRGFENIIIKEQRNCPDLCAEVLAEMVKRVSHIITCQKILVHGVGYNLLSMDDWQEDWERIFKES